LARQIQEKKKEPVQVLWWQLWEWVKQLQWVFLLLVRSFVDWMVSWSGLVLAAVTGQVSATWLAEGMVAW